MKKKVLYIAALAALTLTACNSDDDMAMVNNLDIRLTSSVAQEATRAYDATNLWGNMKCYFWADQIHNETTEDWISEAWELKTGNSQLVPYTNGDTRQYPTVNALNMSAMVGNFTGTIKGSAFPTEGLTHTVEADQTVPTYYYKSDLCYATLGNQSALNGAASLTFNHMLSKIHILLVAGTGVTDAQLTDQTTTVSVLNVRRDVIFTPTKAIGPNSTALAAMLSVPASPTVSPITVKPNVTDGEDVVLPPQTFTSGTSIIKVRLGGDDLYFKLNTNLTLERGKRYNFTLTINRDEIKASATVTNWGAGSNENITLYL